MRLTMRELKSPLLVLEGPNGVGKSNVAKELGAILDALGVPCVLTAEPDAAGQSTLRSKVHSVLLSPDLSGEERILAYCLDRLIHWRQLITPALSEGKAVVCSRGHLSTWVYQDPSQAGLVAADLYSNIASRRLSVVPSICVILTRSLDSILSDLRKDETRTEIDIENVRKFYGKYAGIARTFQFSKISGRAKLCDSSGLTGTYLTTVVDIEGHTAYSSALKVLNKVVAILQEYNLCTDFSKKCSPILSL